VDHGLRRDRLARGLEGLGVDSLLVTHLPNVRYLTGFTGSNGQVLVTPSGSVFFTDGRYLEQAAREVPDVDRMATSAGYAGPALERVRGLGVGRLGFEGELTYLEYGRLTENAAGVELVAVNGVVEGLRMVKDEEELERIRRAQELTDGAFDAFPGIIAEGLTERSAALELEVAMRRGGADGPAFRPIVAFGENAAEPHHEPADRRLRRGDIVKLDFGALVDGYHADMTRTIAFGEPPGRLREIFEVVQHAQRAGADAVAPGVAASEPDRAARAVIEGAGLGDRYTHPTGHGVGLEIHEAPILRASCETRLSAGVVVTIEPGVYLPGLGGVRIEDMVVVTEGGRRSLPRSSKELMVL
jgi:Xaa-Pro aminopeptidase